MKKILSLMLAFTLMLLSPCPVALMETEEELPGTEVTLELGGDSSDDESPEIRLENQVEIVEAETSIALNAVSGALLDEEDHAVTLGVGEKYNLYPADGGTIPSYSSSDKKIAIVNASGKVTAKKVGTCVITVTRDGVSDWCEVTVKKAPTAKSIHFNASEITLGYDSLTGTGESFDLVFSIDDKYASNVVTYSGYNSDIVHLSADNLVTAVGEGTTTITAKTYNSKKVKLKVKVLKAPEALSLEKTFVTLSEGTSYRLTPIVTGGTRDLVRYESDDPTCVLVSESGTLKALSTGSATITAYCFNGLQATCDVTVTPGPTYVQLEPASVTLGKGETQELEVFTDAVSPLTFTTSAKKIATVTSAGLVKGVKKGSAVIGVETLNGRTDFVDVTVLNAPSKVTLDQKNVSLAVDEEYALEATLPKGSTGKITWTSSDEDVALVDDEGVVTGVSVGTAVIKATTYNKKSAKCTVKVTVPAGEILIDPEIDMTRGEIIDLPFEVLDIQGNAYREKIGVAFDPTGIVTLSGDTLRAVKVGETVMTVTAGGLMETCVITVEKPEGFGDGTQVIAHRGGVGDSKERENTLDAFWAALDTGADGVELDVHSTSDGVQVIFHDDSVGGKKIKNWKYEKLVDKYPYIPTLDEALEVLSELDTKIHLELKSSANGAKCVQAINRYGLEDQTIYFGFYETPLKAVYKADPDAILGLSLDKKTNPTSSSVLKKAEKLHIQILVVNMNTLTEARLEKLQEEGYLVSVWTPNTRSACERFYDWGVDYILTDYPSYVAEYR